MRRVFSSKNVRLFCLWVGFLAATVPLAGCKNEGQPIKLDSEYQAVLLDNSQAYFGKAEIGSEYVLLKDVFYIQSQVNQETKEVKNILIKRGKELHGPELMYINKKHVVFIEPIAPDSQVAKLIKEQKAQTQTPAPAATK